MKNEKNVTIKKKKKLRIKVVLLLLLIVYLIGTFIYIIVNSPIDDIIIKGNNYLTEKEILEITNLDENPKVLTKTSSSIRKDLEKSPLVKEVVVSKNLFGKVEITVIENKVLFYNTTENKIILEGNKEVEYSDIFYGVPTLVNYTPNDIYEEFIKELSLIDQELINKISEIEYAPNIKEDITLDEERFIFKMNDTNTVHINLINFNKFNNYNEFCEVQEKRGTLYLDSSNDNHIFDYYE